jgi:hypothetical protein
MTRGPKREIIRLGAGRTISLIAWAAIAAAWALPTPGMVQNSSSFVQAPAAASKPADAIERAAAHPIGPPWTHDAELVDHLGEPLAPEDYSALANPNPRGLLPPVEYAHPYHGRVLLLRDQSQEALRRICGQQPEGTLLGCARRPSAGEVPFVALADEATVKANGWTMNLNELHEAGHLNGSWSHDGWRDLAQLGRPTKPIVIAQADLPSVPSGRPEAIEEDQYDEPPPRRHPRPRYREYPPYGPPPPGYTPTGWYLTPIGPVPCLPQLVGLPFCI